MGPLVSPPSHHERQVIFSSAMTFLRKSLLGSLLMPRRAKGLDSIFCTSDRSCGYMARHGPHQCPQKSSITTFPRYSVSLNFLLSSSFFQIRALVWAPVQVAN